MTSYRARWFKAAVILAYSDGSFDLNPAEAKNNLTENFQSVSENGGTGP
jgi:hypothetical protein